MADNLNTNLATVDLAIGPEQSALEPSLISLNNQGVLDLSQNQTLILLTRTVAQLEFYYDSPTARDFVKKISKRIENEGQNLSPQFLKMYNSLIFRAKFVCLDLLADEEIFSLLQEYLVKYLSLPIEHVDLISQIRKSFVRFILPPNTEPFADALRKSIESNNEILGSSEIKSIGAGGVLLLKPTVSNWLKDYFSFQVGLKVGAGITKGDGNTFGRVSYINKKISEYSLSKQQRDILLKILELDDWLKFGWVQEYVNESKESYIPDDIRQAVEEIFVNDEELYNQVDYQTKPQIQNNQSSNPNSDTVTNNRPKEKPIQEIVKVAAQTARVDKPVAKPVNIDEIIKKKQNEEEYAAPGLKMWDSSAPEMAQGIKSQESRIKADSTNKDKAADIDKKLEDLEKRVSSGK